MLPRSVIVLSGQPLTGKDVLASKLRDVFPNLEHIDVDQMREIIDSNPDGHILENEEERTVMVASYALLARQAIVRVRADAPVVITGTFSREEFKVGLRLLFEYLGRVEIPFKVFRLDAPDEIIEQRIEKRRREGSLSPINTMKRYLISKGNFKIIDFAPVTNIDTSKEDYFEQVLGELN